MNRLEERLRRLGDRLDERYGPIAPDEVGQSAEGERDDSLIDYVPQPQESAEPDDITTPRTRKRRIGVIAAVAAALLLIAGLAVVVDRNSDDVATDSDTPPSVADPVSPPNQTEFIPSPGVVDSLGYSWSRVPHDQAAFDEDAYLVMNDVTAGGPGLVAVGDAAVWTSIDGSTWSQVPHNDALFGEGVIESVTVGGPGLVAVGSVGTEPASDAAVWTSVDGIAWSRVPHNREVFGGERSSFCRGAVMNSVTVGGPGLVAVGSAVALGGHRVAVAWTSVDGSTWSRVPYNKEVFGHPDAVSGEESDSNGCYGPTMFGVTAGGPGLVAVGWRGSPQLDGGNAAVWTSPDGVTWSRVPHDEAVFGGQPDLKMNAVTVGGPGLVAVGYASRDAAVWTSVDGTTWSRVPHDEAVFGRPDLVHSELGMSGVAVGGPGLVAVGSAPKDAAVWTSVDGATWSRVPHDEALFGGTQMRGVTVGGSGLVAVGREYSPDPGGLAVWLARPEK